MTEQDVCIGSLAQQKVYLYWSDVKDICTNAVAKAYEQARKENTKLKTENKKLCKKIDELYENIDMWVAENAKFRELLEEGNNWLKAFYAYEQSDFVREKVKQCLTKINQVLGEE